jgi:hypothetical protein
MVHVERIHELFLLFKVFLYSQIILRATNLCTVTTLLIDHDHKLKNYLVMFHSFSIQLYLKLFPLSHNFLFQLFLLLLKFFNSFLQICDLFFVPLPLLQKLYVEAVDLKIFKNGGRISVNNHLRTLQLLIFRLILFAK